MDLVHPNMLLDFDDLDPAKYQIHNNRITCHTLGSDIKASNISISIAIENKTLRTIYTFGGKPRPRENPTPSYPKNSGGNQSPTPALAYAAAAIGCGGGVPLVSIMTS